MITQEFLDKWKGYAKKANKRPWAFWSAWNDNNGAYHMTGLGGEYAYAIRCSNPRDDFCISSNCADYIGAACNNFDSVIEELEITREERDGYRMAAEQLRAQVDNLTAKLEERTGVCEWVYDDDYDVWETRCGEAYQFEYGEPKDSGKYCPNCGKVFQQVEPAPEAHDA